MERRTDLVLTPGVTTTLALEDGALISGTTQDCTPIADYTKALHNAGIHGSSDWKHAATVPLVMIEKYCNDNGITYRDFSVSREHKKRLLNDPALAAFRVWKGRV
jgi:hypothetical protein